ncbi:MAG TPA: type II secretion system protein GspN [Geopsychrobacteraceae bacterium]|nr:type II secretion system protein GspN [Geopsychrobacteraceae bacterium]
MNFPFKRQAGKAGKRFGGFSRLIPLCVLLFLVSILVGFVTGFPTEVLRERLVQEMSAQTGLAVSSDSLELGLPAKVEFNLSIDPNHPQVAPLTFTRLQITPVWSSLFSSARAASLQGQFAEGNIDAEVGADDHLQLEIDGMRLGPLQNPANPYRLDGSLKGQIDGQQISRPGKAEASFSAEISGLVAIGLDALSLPANLALGTLSVKGKLLGQRVTLEEVLLNGDVAELTGSGTIQLGATPRQTRLNLRVAATPGKAFPESLKPLIELSGLKPKADGSYQFRVAGTMAAAVVR